MDYGVILPHVGAYAREHVVDRLQTVARHAESLGYNSLWVADHVVFPTELKSKYPYHPEGKFPFDPADNFLEPLTVLGYVAACTTTIRLGTGVLIIPYRHPVVTAKVIATLDVLSRGRIILGARRRMAGGGVRLPRFALSSARRTHRRISSSDEGAVDAAGSAVPRVSRELLGRAL
jgi:alkanesulfonate monooxygenase SsuD/methylene tetrahydromethanopterin reductase-like flavin-dependent oxidoreductase (luciferase family)